MSRTFHYGNSISEFEKEVYTRVLMGSIDLARATFLDGTPDTRLDILARWNLYKVGLNYRHGTGHGIGAYGFIHESPIQVNIYIYIFLFFLQPWSAHLRLFYNSKSLKWADQF